jgi:transporter family-2 protein
MTSFSLYAVAVLAGIAAACQGSANGALTDRGGLAPTLLLNSLVVLAGSLMLFVSTGPRTLSGLWSAPWTHYIGGICGLVIVAAMSLVVPRIGNATALALIVLGQCGMGLVIDHFGLLGMQTIPLNASRIGGAVLLVAGVVLLRK